MGQDLMPRYKVARGLHSIHILQRELVAYVEIITVSLWDSEEALNVFLETLPSSKAAPELAGISFEPRTYTLLVSWQSRHPGQSHDVPC